MLGQGRLQPFARDPLQIFVLHQVHAEPLRIFINLVLARYVVGIDLLLEDDAVSRGCRARGARGDFRHGCAAAAPAARLLWVLGPAVLRRLGCWRAPSGAKRWLLAKDSLCAIALAGRLL